MILLPAHPASFAHNLFSEMQVFISASPRMQCFADLSCKIAIWTHISYQLGNSESQDPYAKIVYESLAVVSLSWQAVKALTRLKPCCIIACHMRKELKFKKVVLLICDLRKNV